MDESTVPDLPWRQAAVGRRANRSERELAKTDGGRRQPASGSKWYAKGDVRANGFLIDDKITDDESYRLSAKTINKAVAEALQTPPGLRPQLRITMKGAPKVRVLLEDDYLYLEARASRDE